MAVENIRANVTQDVAFNKPLLKAQTPPVGKPEKKENGNVLLYGSLGALAVLGTAGTIIYKARKGKISTQEVNELKEGLTTFKAGKAYDDAGKLFTGTISRTSKTGNKLDTHYIDGVIVRRDYTLAAPVKGEYGETIKQISKTYDTKTYDGVRMIRIEKTSPDGKKTYAFSANFTERKFPPEVESKIKMRDFDKMRPENFVGDEKDLGDGLVLIKEGAKLKLKHNGQTIRSVEDEGVISTYKNGEYEFFDKTIVNFKDGTVSLFSCDSRVSHLYSFDGSYSRTIYADENGNLLAKTITEKFDALGNPINS